VAEKKNESDDGENNNINSSNNKASDSLPAPPAPQQQEDEDVEEEEEEEQVGNDDDDDENMFGGFADVFSVAKQKKAKKNASPPAPKVLDVAVKAEIPAVAEASEKDEDCAKAEEEEVTAPPEPVAVAAKKEIDWTELTYKKNRPTLVFQSLQVLNAHHVDEETAAKSNAMVAKGATETTSARAYPNNHFNEMIIGAALSKAAAVPAGAPAKESGAKKGSTKQSEKPSPPLPLAPSSQLAVQRVAREVVFCRRNPLANVRFAIVGDNVLEWHVNVSPTDGPLSGVIVPLCA
jgi:hypothetical protein